VPVQPVAVIIAESKPQIEVLFAVAIGVCEGKTLISIVSDLAQDPVPQVKIYLVLVFGLTFKVAVVAPVFHTGFDAQLVEVI
jgi:hypothetical protein